MAMYDNDNTVKTSFDLGYISEYLQQAQWAELVELKKVIKEVAERMRRPISILDIGIGNARVPKSLSGIREIWSLIAQYEGTDNAMNCVNLSGEIVRQAGINDKVKITYGDAKDFGEWNSKYDMVITTWFTAGNFHPDDFPFDSYDKESQPLDLSVNRNFTKIISNAWNLLQEDGEIVLGACYKDNDATRQKQEESYRKMGMTVITGPGDSFTATKEKFWSQRFTRERLLGYLSFIPEENFIFTDLDTYEYAWQVRIRKR